MAVPATANQGSPAWTKDVERWLFRLQGHTKVDRCFQAHKNKHRKQKKEGQPISITYLGIPGDEPKISKGVRKKLNEYIASAIPKQFNMRTGQAYGAVIGILQRRDGDTDGRSELRKLYNSDMFLHVSVDRWGPQTISLKLQLIIFQPDSGSVCTTENYSASENPAINLDSRTLEKASDEQMQDITNTDIYDLNGALRISIIKHIGDLNARRDLDIKVLSTRSKSADFKGETCKLEKHMSAALRDAYSNAREIDKFMPQKAVDKWPKLKSNPVDDENQQLASLVVETSISTEPSAVLEPKFIVVKVNTAIEVDGAVTSGKKLEVAIPSNWLDRCTNASLTQLQTIEKTAADPGYRSIQLLPKKSNFIPGQSNLEVDILFIDNAHLYCWMIGDDRTATILFPPMERKDLALPANRNPYLFPNRFFPRQPSGNPVQLAITGSGESLFGCFTSRVPVPWQEVLAPWQNQHGTTIDWDMVNDFIKKFRKVPGIAETYVRINHRSPKNN